MPASRAETETLEVPTWTLPARSGAVLCHGAGTNTLARTGVLVDKGEDRVLGPRGAGVQRELHLPTLKVHLLQIPSQALPGFPAGL
jgi:hypothetical protein